MMMHLHTINTFKVRTLHEEDVEEIFNIKNDSCWGLLLAIFYARANHLYSFRIYVASWAFNLPCWCMTRNKQIVKIYVVKEWWLKGMVGFEIFYDRKFLFLFSLHLCSTRSSSNEYLCWHFSMYASNLSLKKSQISGLKTSSFIICLGLSIKLYSHHGWKNVSIRCQKNLFLFIYLFIHLSFFYK